ncbi:hypothetical protein BN874_1150003 [Candidatus Contendobacter odensis Run_B_J11]|uniref:Uncharacterized protein n=1 Tax=Candidatus Contendobacter odensis Run_B_J11 TaxID=1400861 RepID=A0A7U7G872_9GAMM|nr:hypothetical protein BN874_1150003 [Candidatus Contendobacter odensis Run_B_J11]
MPITNDVLFAECLYRWQMRAESVSLRTWRYAFLAPRPGNSKLRTTGYRRCAGCSTKPATRR